MSPSAMAETDRRAITEARKGELDAAQDQGDPQRDDRRGDEERAPLGGDDGRERQRLSGRRQHDERARARGANGEQ